MILLWVLQKWSSSTGQFGQNVDINWMAIIISEHRFTIEIQRKARSGNTKPERRGLPARCYPIQWGCGLCIAFRLRWNCHCHAIFIVSINLYDSNNVRCCHRHHYHHSTAMDEAKALKISHSRTKKKKSNGEWCSRNLINNPCCLRINRQ